MAISLDVNTPPGTYIFESSTCVRENDVSILHAEGDLLL